MALTSNLSLNNNAAAAKTFNENKRSGSRVERLRSDTTLALPSRLVIDHSVTNGGGVTSDRHLIQVATTESDGNGGTGTTIVNLTISVPRTVSAAATTAKDAVAFICDLLQDAGAANAAFTSILQGES